MNRPTPRPTSRRHPFLLGGPLILLALLVAPAAHAEPDVAPAWLDVALDGPGRRLVPGQLVLKLDGADVGLAPATLSLPPSPASDPHELRVETVDGTYAYVLRLVLDAAGVRVLDARAVGCTAVEPCTTVTRSGDRWRLAVYFVRKDNPACERTKRAWGPTNQTILVKFESAPPGAEVWYPLQPGKNDPYDLRFKGRTGDKPLLLTVSFLPGTELKVYFKKPGHTDGIVHFRMESGRQGRALVVIDRQGGQQRLSIADSGRPEDAPVLTTTLTPIPPTR